MIYPIPWVAKTLSKVRWGILECLWKNANRLCYRTYQHSAFGAWPILDTKSVLCFNFDHLILICCPLIRCLKFAGPLSVALEQEKVIMHMEIESFGYAWALQPMQNKTISKHLRLVQGRRRCPALAPSLVTARPHQKTAVKVICSSSLV